MPYFAAGQLQSALAYLNENTNTLLLSLLAMFRSPIPLTPDASGAVPFGQAQETGLLVDYFSPAGAPSGRPYYLCFGGSGDFRDKLYPGRTLQRIRNDVSADIFWHPDAKRWSFRPGYVTKLQSYHDRFKQGNVSLSALAVWLYRQTDVQSIAGAVDHVITDFQLNRDNLIGTFLLRDEQRFSDADLRAEPMSDQEIAQLLGASPPAAEPPDWVDFEPRLRQAMRKSRVQLTDELLRAIIVAWLARDIVVLVGSPGTGKTTIADAIPECLTKVLGDDQVARIRISINNETDVSNVIGYENLDGALVPSEFTKTLLLETTNRLRTCVVVLDEFNLANVDAYLAPLLSAIESQQPVTLPGQAVEGRGDAFLPVDTFVIATCNSFVEEPDTRLPLSRPVKRRCTILTVPNLLAERVAKDGVASALSAIGTDLLERERSEVTERSDAHSATSFDRYRLVRLKECQQYDDLDLDLRNRLEAVIQTLLGDPSGRRFLTIGVFKDVLLSIVMAPAADRLAALTRQLASKVVHIFSGSVETLRQTAEHLRGTPDFAVIEEMVAYVQEHEVGGTVPPLV
jgi:MoxR-like ATPase